MGYFDGIVDVYFKKNDLNQRIFYPWGKFGAGLILESEEKYSSIRGTLKNAFIFFFAAVISIQIFFGAWFTLALLALYYVWYFLWLKQVTSNLAKSDEKLTVDEAIQNSAKSHNLYFLIFMEICCVLFVGIGAWSIIAQENPSGYFILFFFSFCLFQITRLLLAKIRQNKR